MSKPKIDVSVSCCSYINQEEVHINNDSHTYYLLVSGIRNVNSDDSNLVYAYKGIFGLREDVDTLQYKSLTISPSTGISVKDMIKCDVDLHGALSDYKGCYYDITGTCPIDVYVDGIKCTANKSGSYTIFAVSTDYISWLKNEVDNNFGIDSYKKALADNKKYDDDLNAYNNAYNNYITQQQNYTVYKKQLDAYNTAKAKYDSDKKLYDEYLAKKQKYDKYISDLQIYNSVMNTYNKKLEQYNKDMEQYKKDLEEYNKTHNSGGNTENSETNTDNNDSKTE